jgi:cytochrome c-type biogenesis protein CcmH/NrfG
LAKIPAVHRFPLSPKPWWCLGLAVLLGAVVACEKKDKPPVSDAPPPVASSGAPSDPKMAKAMEEVIAYKVRIDKDPNDVEALAAMGNVNMSLGRFDHAKEWYGRALKVDPNRTTTRMDLAVSLRYLGKPDEAIAELKSILAKDPRNAGALYNLGVILLEDKKDEKGAIARWETLMKAYPDHPQTAQLRQMVEQIKHPTSSPPSPPGG